MYELQEVIDALLCLIHMQLLQQSLVSGPLYLSPGNKLVAWIQHIVSDFYWITLDQGLKGWYLWTGAAAWCQSKYISPSYQSFQCTRADPFQPISGTWTECHDMMAPGWELAIFIRLSFTVLSSLSYTQWPGEQQRRWVRWYHQSTLKRTVVTHHFQQNKGDLVWRRKDTMDHIQVCQLWGNVDLCCSY